MGWSPFFRAIRATPLLKDYLALYARWSGDDRGRRHGPLLALRLENSPLLLTPQGPSAAPATKVLIRLPP
jgi:hypothetical protein